MNIHALWCHPRSVSTAFERLMRERHDMHVLHEPFMYDYYLNQSTELFPDFIPEAGHPLTFTDIREMILQHAVKQPVFFKDMAYYVERTLPKDTEFLSQMTHSFLIRDPAESILSYHRRDPNFSVTEVGLEAQYRLFQSLHEAGVTPYVVTADDLRTDPHKTLRKYWEYVKLPYVDGAFEWDNKVPDGWEAVKGWHTKALSSGAIQKPSNARDYHAELVRLGRPYTEYDAHHRPFYDALKNIAAHQK
jgi:hypothetical protein